MSRFELARAAVAALRAQVENSDASASKRDYKIQTELILRESTGAPRGTTTRAAKPQK
jgi:DNA-binding LacI/PurR family transcriptional regulator